MAEALAGPALAATRYASVQAMAEWLAAAASGQRMSYASGPALDPKAGPVLLAARWIAEGRALPLKERGADGVLRHLLEKRAVPRLAVLSGAGAARPFDEAQDRNERISGDDERRLLPDGRPAPQVVMLAEGSDEARIYRLLSRCANLGLVCPSNAKVAELLDLPGHPMLDRQGVAYRVRQLVKLGLIAFPADVSGKAATGAPGCSARRVRIVASGRVTA